MTANEKDFELGFWGNCTNTFHEELKQWRYAQLMGIRREHWSLRVFGASIVDIGGGPVSMLLKCHDLGKAMIVDPLAHHYPEWTLRRYWQKGIEVNANRGEDIGDGTLYMSNPYDEAWIYNVLQHVDDPALVIRRALAVCRKLRIFEWVNVPACPGHPHELTEVKLNEWLGTSGDTIPLSYDGCHGLAYVNVVDGRAR